MTEDQRRVHRLSLSNISMKLPLRERTVMYVSRNIMQPDDNTRLLLEELAFSGIAGGFRHIVAVREFDGNYFTFKEQFSGLDIRFVLYDSDEFIKALSTAGRIISDGGLPLYFIKRPKQIHLCLFDQRALLFSEDEKGLYHHQIYTELNRLVPQTSFMLCPNEEVFRRMNEKLFIEGHFSGRLILAGEPSYYGKAAEEAAPSESSAKYSPADISAILEEYAPKDSNDDPADEYSRAMKASPDRNTAMENIAGALFYGEGEYFEFSKSTKKKIAVIAYMQLFTRNALELRNFCNMIDKQRFDVTVFSYATTSALLFAGFEGGTRIIMRDSYTVSEKGIKLQLEASEGVEEDELWKNEILRSLGSDDFDAVLVYNTVNPFRHRAAEYMNAGLRIYATPGEDELLSGEADPEALADMINRIYDKTLLLNGSGKRLAHCQPMPAVYSSIWKELTLHLAEPAVYSDGKRELIAVNPSPTAPFGCTLIPKPDKKHINIFAVVSDGKDAAKLREQFDEYRLERPSARLYMNILNGSAKDVSELSDEFVTVTAERKLPVILLALCDRFVYPYEGGSGLNTAAAFFGTAAQPEQHSASELLLMAGPENKTLLSGYEAALPDGKFSADLSSFEPPANDRDMPEKYTREIYGIINDDIFSFERQEDNE